MTIRILHGDCREELPKLAAAGERFHACVCDPPYELKFMGRKWDGTGVSFKPETWRAVFDCLLPGAHLLAFGGTRTYHRLVCAIEDAGFEVRDTIGWVFGSGFPKSLDVSKAIDKAAGAVRERVRPVAIPRGQRDGTNALGGSWQDDPYVTAPATPEAEQWAGWGTALKPSIELVCVARKPFTGTVAANVLKYGCGGLNIDASRVDGAVNSNPLVRNAKGYRSDGLANQGATGAGRDSFGRWPANLIHSGSDEVLAAFPDTGQSSGGMRNNGAFKSVAKGAETARIGFGHEDAGGSAARFFKSCPYSEEETASRLFYTSKADARDRQGSKHPTVKPGDLMRYLVRLVTPPGGTVLDPFAGTGSTGLAADQLGMHAVLIEQDATYAEDARRKLYADAPLFADVDAGPMPTHPVEDEIADLFAEAAE